MNYLLIVTGSPYGTENSSTALLFARALINYGHTLNNVFFYFNGVLNASKMVSSAEDEFNLIKGWQELSYNFKINLNICISSAYRRGVIGDEQALKIGINKGNIAHGFVCIGLSELSESFQMCDRIVQF